MNREVERQSNDRRREEAAQIIMENVRQKQHRATDEKLLDREALRLAAIRAGLEKPGDDNV